MRSRQMGFSGPVYFIVMGALVLGTMFMFYTADSSTKTTRYNKETMRELGYELITAYSRSNKFMPDSSPCIEGEFVFVDRHYNVVPTLAEARGAMCKIKPQSNRNVYEKRI